MDESVIIVDAWLCSACAISLSPRVVGSLSLTPIEVGSRLGHDANANDAILGDGEETERGGEEEAQIEKILPT